MTDFKKLVLGNAGKKRIKKGNWSSINRENPNIKLNGKIYKRNTSYYDRNKYCHDCGILNKRGTLHKLGCDIERCPRCKGQLISCNCKKG
jgi:hypothetical protein